MQLKLFRFYLYAVLFALFLLMGVNFYHALMVAPDTVDMEAFRAAILSSPGFWLDMGHFFAGLLLIHFCWIVILWFGTAGWLKNSSLPLRQRKLLAFLCFLIVWLFVLIWSGRLYPNLASGFLKHSQWMLSDPTFYLLFGIICISSCVSIVKLFKSIPKPVVRMWVGLTSVFLVFFVGLGFYSNFTVAELKSSSSKPNIFVIGIDSVRPDETGFFGGYGGLTPNIDEFLEKSQVHENTYTPYARTFPAWMSILTGLEPVRHKGRFNLINHKHLNKSLALGHQLQEEGYRTIYAFDERRFNSMDESFGYDAVVGPKHAAWSFVASGVDHPIINLVCNTVVGKYLFPGIYLNRGRHGNYEPEKYNQAIVTELLSGDERPVFLTAHFLLPHWPWTSRKFEELEAFETPENPMTDSLFRYRQMLSQVDRQFGSFMSKLESAGLLDNTYVFLLSDHGDGFALEKDNLVPGVETNARLETNTRGHATNIFNLGQYRVLMAARSYGNSRFDAQVKEELSSLMDIYPTVLDLIEPKEKNNVSNLDGVSMLSQERENRKLFLETGFSVLELTEETINVEDLIKNGIDAYTVDKRGKLVVKDQYYDLIISSKHRAVMEENWMLALVPSMGNHPVLVNWKEKKWWPVEFYEGSKDWKAMLDAICQHYKNDVGFDQKEVCLAYKGKV